MAPKSTSTIIFAVAPHPNTANIRSAYILFSMGKYGRAARQYKKTLQLYPSDIPLQLGSAWSYFKMGKKQAASRWFARVLSVRPSNTSALEGTQAVRR